MTATPRTTAGRALFTDNEPMDMWESDGVTVEDILAIEAEAAALDVERLAKALDRYLHFTLTESVCDAILTALREEE